jgi:hypothetical protein
MMHEPEARTFDSNSVLRQVSQGDYPNSWRVFFGSDTFVNNSGIFGIYIFFLVLFVIPFYFSIYVISRIIYGCAIGDCFSGDFSQFLWGAFFVIVFLGALIFLTIRGLDKEIRKQSQQPAPTIVVMPDGVVAYSRQQIRSLAFAEIAHMQLRVQANTQVVTTYTTTTTYDGTTIRTPSTSVVSNPYIWLDLIFYGGRRDNWSIDIAPQDMIAQCILDAYNAYRVTKERQEK